MNAAESYREAFAQLPKAELGVLLGSFGRDDPEIDELMQAGRASLDLLHDAGRSADCDWGPEAALGTPVDDFGGARRLAVLGLLRAERAFRRGDLANWLEDTIAVFALSRHLGRGKYISGLASFAIEDLAAKKTTEVLDGLDAATCRTLAARLETLPAFPSLADAVRDEANFFRTHYLDKFEALVDGDVPSVIRKEYGIPATNPEAASLSTWIYPAGDPAERMLVASGGKQSGLLTLAEAALSAFDALAEIAGDPASVGAERLGALRDASGSNPLLADVVRSFDTMSPIWKKYADQFAVLRSKLAARID